MAGKTMTDKNLNELFSEERLAKIFPEDRADRFFDALLGDPAEGAYDIRLIFRQQTENRLEFEFQLTQRPGKCLVCSLTHGLPKVFSRHPVIDVKGVVAQIGRQLDGLATCVDWKLGDTHEISRQLHVIPLSVFLE